MKKIKLSFLEKNVKCMVFTLSCIFLLLSSGNSFAQNSVKGVVRDQNGQELIGVKVVVKGTTKGTITDVSGKFSIDVANKNVTLQFTHVGYKKIETTLQGKSFLDVVMKEDTELLDEVVVVGYGLQNKLSITGAISSISERELIKAPSVGITNVVGARVAGVSMLQSTGQPGGDAASLLVRGQKAVYIVDGVQRNFNEIDPNSVESVSVLKDATSAAVYGLDASAVIIVTTKRGKKDKLHISYNGKYGFSQNTNQLEWLDGPGYAYWYNKSREMDGDPAVFTSEQVQKMKAGVDGWGNTNWYDKVFGTGTTMHHNVSASGGNDKVNFFTSIGAFDQKGNVDLD